MRYVTLPPPALVDNGQAEVVLGLELDAAEAVAFDLITEAGESFGKEYPMAGGFAGDESEW